MKPTDGCPGCGAAVSEHYKWTYCRKCREKPCAWCGVKFVPDPVKQRKNCPSCNNRGITQEATAGSPLGYGVVV